VRRAAITRPDAGWLLGAAAAGFLGGVLLMSVPRGVAPPAIDRERVRSASSGEAVAAAAPPTVATPAIGPDPLEDLRRRRLELPVRGLQRDELRDTFHEMRGGTRRHEALDILAPRATPVVAVEDGTIAKLFLSDAGGMTIYQFDPASAYAYYYAHLERYAAGLQEGDRVARGQVIGYVGTSGNAPKDTPHLHFAVIKLTDAKRWWQGIAIDPYPILK
jgi:murein DD-endopeptidase MepM/ murein hydrolase activator NlpD